MKKVYKSSIEKPQNINKIVEERDFLRKCIIDILVAHPEIDTPFLTVEIREKMKTLLSIRD